jgi:hypothetical protein
MNNGSIFKGRLEMPKDSLAIFSYAVSHPREFIILNFDREVGAEFGPPDAEVTFKLCRKGGADTYDSDWVRQHLEALYNLGLNFRDSDGEDWGIELHVFCQSVKLLKDYDGARDECFWAMKS